MFADKETTISNKENVIFDPQLVKSLAEVVLEDASIKTQMERLGFQQFSPPHTGFIAETIAPELSEEETKSWFKSQDQKKQDFFDNMTEEEKNRIATQQTLYNSSLNFIIPQVITSLELLKDNKYGLGDVFMAEIQGLEPSSQKMIEIMKSKGVNVSEFPDQQEGFDGENNHGEARFIGDTWTAKFNNVALSEPVEVLHELVAIECFDIYIRNTPSLKDTLALLPVGLILLSNGRSFKDSIARGQYKSKDMLIILIIEAAFDLISKLSKDHIFVKEFSESISPEEAK